MDLFASVNATGGQLDLNTNGVSMPWVKLALSVPLVEDKSKPGFVTFPIDKFQTYALVVEDGQPQVYYLDTSAGFPAWYVPPRPW